jgi:hypothetical protein
VTMALNLSACTTYNGYPALVPLPYGSGAGVTQTTGVSVNSYTVTNGSGARSFTVITGRGK